MTAPSIREALKPCPFCGSDRVSSAHQRDGRVIGCAGCGARVGAFQPGAEEKATEKWNTRTTPAPPQDVVEGIARVIVEFARKGFQSIRLTRDVGPYEITEPTPVALEFATAILASGLVTVTHPDEAAIRADEREKCARLANDDAGFREGTSAAEAGHRIAAAIRAGGAK